MIRFIIVRLLELVAKEICLVQCLQINSLWCKAWPFKIGTASNLTSKIKCVMEAPINTKLWIGMKNEVKISTANSLLE